MNEYVNEDYLGVVHANFEHPSELNFEGGQECYSPISGLPTRSVGNGHGHYAPGVCAGWIV